MALRRTLSLAAVAVAASGAVASAPAHATTDCRTVDGIYAGCVHVLENGCVVYGSGTRLGGPFIIRCVS